MTFYFSHLLIQRPIYRYALLSLFLLCVPTHSLCAEENVFPDYQTLLETYVDHDRVNYPSLKKNPELLQGARKSFENITAMQYQAWDTKSQMAFWINTYNLSAISLIIDHYPLKRGLHWKALAYPENSIQKIADVWHQSALVLLGKRKTLHEIEHEILRKTFRDPRIHFALVCASIGCPGLLSEAYSGQSLDAQLKDQVQRFLSDKEKVHYDTTSKTLYLSPIFKWFKTDFEEKQGSVLQWITHNDPPFFSEIHTDLTESKSQSLNLHAISIKYLDYDWSLNEKT